MYNKWWESGLRNFLVIQQPDAQWFESRGDEYFFFIFLFSLSFSLLILKVISINLQNLVKIYGASHEL